MHPCSSVLRIPFRVPPSAPQLTACQCPLPVSFACERHAIHELLIHFMSAHPTLSGALCIQVTPGLLQQFLLPLDTCSQFQTYFAISQAPLSLLFQLGQ